MTGLVRKATLLSGALLLVAGMAAAGVPNAAKSVLPPGIQLGGTNAAGTIVDPKVQAVVNVRDAGNNPVLNSTVELQFGACVAGPNWDMNVFNTQPFAGLAFNCVARTVTAISDGLGNATFRIVGRANAAPGNTPGLGTTPCVNVVADGQPLGTLRVAAYDLNGGGGVNPSDLALFLGTLFASPAGYRQRCDYDGSGACTPADLAKFLAVQFGAGSTTSGTGGVCF